MSNNRKVVRFEEIVLRRSFWSFCGVAWRVLMHESDVRVSTQLLWWLLNRAFSNRKKSLLREKVDRQVGSFGSFIKGYQRKKYSALAGTVHVIVLVQKRKTVALQLLWMWSYFRLPNKWSKIFLNKWNDRTNDQETYINGLLAKNPTAPPTIEFGSGKEKKKRISTRKRT